MTGLTRWLTRHIPVPVVKGIQLGAGLRLIISAGSSLILPLGWLSPLLDNRLWAVVVFLTLLVVTLPPRGSGGTPPFALLVFVLGVCFSVLGILLLEPPGGGGGENPVRPSLPGWEVWRPGIYMPELGSWGSVGMAMGQLPLTMLNSIIAVSALAGDLFGGEPLQLPVVERGGPGSNVRPPEAPSTTSLGISVAVMNILGCFFGCMPVCHGSGGLAAQHRFGARSGSSVILLGGFKIVLGLFLGKSLLGVLNSFPRSILGVMVAAAGLELARVGSSLNYGATDLYTWEDVGGADDGGGQQQNKQKRHRILSDAERDERWMVMLMTTGGILAFRNDAVGFVAGLLCHGVSRLGEMESGSGGGEGGRITGTGRRRGYRVGVPVRKYLSRRRQRSIQGQARARTRTRTEESLLLGSD